MIIVVLIGAKIIGVTLLRAANHNIERDVFHASVVHKHAHILTTT